MRIDLQCDSPEKAAVLRPYVAQRMNAAMSRFRTHIQWARVKVTSVSSESGSQDKRCVVQLRLRNLPDVVFAITRLDARVAVDQAAERLSRVLAQRVRRVQLPPVSAAAMPPAVSA